MLAGGFQRLGDQVRVTARVIEVESGKVLRAAKCDGGIQEIFSLQDRVVGDLVSGLRRSVSDVHEGKETKVVAAYQALAKGLLNLRNDSYESVDRGILFFERAVALDPSYLRAQIELGAAYSQKADYLVAPELHRKSEVVLRRALESDPRLPRAWRELGAALVAQARIDEGVECLQRALTLAPDDPRVLAGMGRALFVGRGDFAGALAFYDRALARAPQAGWYWMQKSHCHALLRQFEDGEPAARRAIELQEEFLSGQQGVQLVGGYMRFAHLCALQGRFDDAAASCRQEQAFVDGLDHALRSRIRIELSLRLGSALVRLGDREAADASFRAGLEGFDRRVALGADDPFTRYYAAAIHAMRGSAPEALELLESAMRESPHFMRARAAIEPEWDDLRGDPRFQRILI
ncbi:MAG: tetratricopeptide repeat protein [Candidatus Eisenbacteria bacterium]